MLGINLSGKPRLPASLFNMWRCVIIIAHADGTVSEEEHAYFAKVFAALADKYSLTEEQKSTFAADLETPQELNDLLPLVKEPGHRAMLISFGEILAQADGVVSPAEEEIMEHLCARIEGVDTAALREEVRKSLQESRPAGDASSQKAHAQNQLISPIIATLDDFLRQHFQLEVGFD